MQYLKRTSLGSKIDTNNESRQRYKLNYLVQSLLILFCFFFNNFLLSVGLRETSASCHFSYAQVFVRCKNKIKKLRMLSLRLINESTFIFLFNFFYLLLLFHSFLFGRRNVEIRVETSYISVYSVYTTYRMMKTAIKLILEKMNEILVNLTKMQSHRPICLDKIKFRYRSNKCLHSFCLQCITD